MGTGVGGCQAVDVRDHREGASHRDWYGRAPRTMEFRAFLEAGRLATVIGGGGMRGSSSRVTARPRGVANLHVALAIVVTWGTDRRAGPCWQRKQLVQTADWFPCKQLVAFWAGIPFTDVESVSYEDDRSECPR